MVINRKGEPDIISGLEKTMILHYFIEDTKDNQDHKLEQYDRPKNTDDEICKRNK